MQVHVNRVSAMPHNVEVFLDGQPGGFDINVDESLSAERMTQVLEAAFNMAVEDWRPAPDVVERPHLHLHTG